jgi:RNA polymerase sigma-70 factor (ECF subfamily)
MQPPSELRGRGPSPAFALALAPEAPSDASLVARAAAGDAGAVGALYDRHWTAVYALAHAVVRDAGDAEDVVAATFAQLWREATRYDPARGTVAGWLAVVARSRALDVLRRRRRRDHYTEAAAATVTGAEGEGGAAHGDALETPDAALERHELAAAVRTSLAALPAGQRRAIELAYFGGLSHSAVAESLGEPLGTVKSRIRLGMEKLRDALRVWGPAG